MNTRCALLTAALGFLQAAAGDVGPPRPPRVARLAAGVGHVVVGMERQGYAVSLARVSLREGRRAAFYADAMTSAAGFAVAPTPRQAAQRAAWAAVRRGPAS